MPTDTPDPLEAAKAFAAETVKRLPPVHREAIRPDYEALRAALAAAPATLELALQRMYDAGWQAGVRDGKAKAAGGDSGVYGRYEWTWAVTGNDDGTWAWAIYDGPNRHDDDGDPSTLVLSGVTDTDPTPVLAALVTDQGGGGLGLREQQVRDALHATWVEWGVYDLDTMVAAVMALPATNGPARPSPTSPDDGDRRPCDGPTDYTDPRTVDVDVVIGEISHAYRTRGGTWTDERSWPNVTVAALAAEIVRLRDQSGRARSDHAYRVIRRLLTGWRVIQGHQCREWHGPNGEFEATSALDDEVLDRA